MKVNDSKMLMMRLITENSVCTLLQVFIMHPEKYHYAKENPHHVLNQSQRDLQLTNYFLWLLPYV